MGIILFTSSVFETQLWLQNLSQICVRRSVSVCNIHIFKELFKRICLRNGIFSQLDKVLWQRVLTWE